MQVDRDDERVVVIGYGPAGQTLIRLLRSLNVPFIAVDTNPSAALEARETGEPVIYGDATRPQVLRHLEVWDARLVAVRAAQSGAVQKNYAACWEGLPRARVTFGFGASGASAASGISLSGVTRPRGRRTARLLHFS